MKPKRILSILLVLCLMLSLMPGGLVTMSAYAADAPNYDVRFDVNVPATASTTAVGSMENQSFACGEKKALSENGYSLPGYSFDGWNTKADGTGTAFADEAEVQDLSEEGGTVTLYAQWSGKPYMIEYWSDAAGSKKPGHTAYFDRPGKLDAYSDGAFGWNSGGETPLWEGGDPTKVNQTIEVQGKADITPHAAPISLDLSQDDDGNYLIASESDWNDLAVFTDNGGDTSGMTFLQTADISVTKMVGTSANPFKGTYDGGGKTLTFTLESQDERIAPFRYIRDAAIRGLQVAGSITVSGKRAAGLIGENNGASTVTDCRVSAEITGSGLIGGFCIGTGDSLTITGCVFDGAIKGSPNQSGCFVAWGTSGLRLTDCMADPREGTDYTGCTFCCEGGGSPDLTNCWYRGAFGTVQGSRAYFVKGGDGVTLDFGTPAAEYAVSGVTAYSKGLACGDLFYSGEGESVSFTASFTGTLPEGETAAFTASAGTLTQSGGSYTLTMPAQDVTISAVGSVPYVDPTDPDDPNQTAVCAPLTLGGYGHVELTDGWYVLNTDMPDIYIFRVYGDVNIILCDGCTLTDHWGILVSPGSSLTIWGQTAGTGTITADGGGSSEPGIRCTDASVTINGGTVVATGDVLNPGIGGYYYDDDFLIYQGDCGTVTIHGGTVIATGGWGGAGIGGGDEGAGGTVTITGGTVTAIAGQDAQAIGHGYDYEGSANVELSCPGMRVYASEDATEPVAEGERENACRGTWAKLEVCDPHSYDEHTGACEYCGALSPVPYVDPTDPDQQSKTCTEYTVLTDQTELSSGWYVVNTNVEISSRITVSGDVNLLLVDGVTLTAEKGINAAEGNSLTIWAQSDATVTGSSAGRLFAGTDGSVDANGDYVPTGDESYAGVGGGVGETAGTIVLNGGFVTAVGSYIEHIRRGGGAGIGGGADGSGGTVTVNGGMVEAVGGQCAAGIGSSGDLRGKLGLNGGDITVNGGVVSATGNLGGAGIGGGFRSSGGNVVIHGGTIVATAPTGIYPGTTQRVCSGAGIGSGGIGNGGTFTIYGGDVTATAGDFGGAGIGNGGEGRDFTVNIYGGTVVATGAGGAGIGSGEDNDDSGYDSGLIFTMEGGTVTAVSKNGDALNYALSGAGIGGGRGCQGGNVTITGGVVTAAAGEGAQAIGRGGYGFGANGASSGSLSLYDEAVVLTGEDYQTVVTGDGREDACRGERAKIVPAASGVSYLDPTDEAAPDKTCYIYTTLTDQTELSSGWYVVNTNVEISSRITVSGDVKLILTDGCTLTAPKGINVSEGNSFTVYGQTNQTGALFAGTDGTDATCNHYAAGIGGRDRQAGGNVTINGGAVTANGGLNAAGIGGGDGKAGGNVAINGGTVTATGGNRGAGIGGGQYGAGDTVLITGGTVNATGGGGGAGIGGGPRKAGGTVVITGGTVTANGGINSAGIGGGTYGAGGEITISGGTVSAQVGNYNVNSDGEKPQAIGRGNNYTGNTLSEGNLSIGAGLRVYNAEDADEPVPSANRKTTCRGDYAKVTPCYPHSYDDTGVCEYCDTAGCLVTLTAAPPAGGTVSGGGGYDSGASVTVTATANPGYKFDGWEEGGAVVSTDASYTFTVTGSRTLTASFSRSYYFITVKGGTTDHATAVPGETVTITANPATGETAFVQWPDIEDVQYANANALTTTFSMPAKDLTIEPVYAAILIWDIDDQVYTGEEIRPTVHVELDGVDVAFQENTDYAITYANNVNAGKATLTVTFLDRDTRQPDPNMGVKSKNFMILPADISAATVQIADQTYAGAALTPPATVTWNGKTLTTNDCTLSYSGNVNAGQATVTVTGKGNFTGTAYGHFTIHKAPLTITADSDTKVYDGTPLMKNSYQSTGLAGSDRIASVTVTGSRTEVGSSDNVPSAAMICNGNGEDVTNNYAITYVNGTLTITAKAVTVRAEDKEKTVGEEDPELTAIVDGTLGQDAVTYALSREPGEDVGTYTITPSGEAEQGNYAVTYLTGTLTIYELCHFGHTLTGTPAAAATCLTDGNSAYYTCSVCGKYFSDAAGEHEIGKDSWIIPALGHDWGEASYDWSDDFTSCTATVLCTHDASHNITETVQTSFILTQPSTYKEEGKGVYVASFEDAHFTEQRQELTIPVVGCDSGPDCPSAHFNDRPAAGHWAHIPIDWAVVNNITSGTSATTFSPNQNCTRAQFVTFLWRIKGQPEPSLSESPFKDVRQGTWYYKAVLWAVENGITAGSSATTFSPNNDCSRAQVVTFLWRMAGCEEPTLAENPFTDVAEGRWYAKAVLWAFEHGITAGTSATTFSPTSACTRAQCMTFLFRQFAE